MSMALRLERQLPWVASIGFHALLALLLLGHWSTESRRMIEPPAIRAVVLEKALPASRAMPVTLPKVQREVSPAKPPPQKTPAVVKPSVTKPVPSKVPTTRPKPQPDFAQPDMAAQMAKENIAMAKASETTKPAALPVAEAPAANVEADSEMAEAVAAIKSALGAKWQRPPSARNGMVVELQIQLMPGGDVVSVTVVRSSGDKNLDASAVSAVQNASPLPVPSGKAFENFRRFILHFRPEDLRL